MDRREMLRAIAALTGTAFVGTDRTFVAASDSSVYTPTQVTLLDDIAETILPRTDMPGAKDAQVGACIARYSAACYTPANLEILRAGLGDIDTRSHKACSADFMRCTRKQKENLLVAIDVEAKRHARGDRFNQPPHWFTLCKQLTLMCFFTSEVGATQVARYRPVPGPYKGMVAYKGETFWAW